MSSSSREDSPDWLRNFQGPTLYAVTLSSDTESPLSEEEEDYKNLKDLFHKKVEESSDKEKDDSDGESDPVYKTQEDKSLGETQKAKQPRGRKRLRGGTNAHTGTKAGEHEVESELLKEPVSTRGNYSVLTLSSDSDTSEPHHVNVQDVPMEIDEVPTDDGGESHLNETSTVKGTKKQVKKTGNNDKKLEKVDAHKTSNLDTEEAEKSRGLHVSSARVPLVMSEKVSRSKVLVECEGDSIDLSGDVGAVGRVVISDDSRKELLLDLKGTIYRTTIVPSRTFCVVNFVQSEAKIEAIMNDFIQLEPQSNVYEAETMVEGTLDGFLFDSEEEREELPKNNNVENQNEDGEEQSHGETKTKAKKTIARKKAKPAAGKGKMQKKTKKKPSAPKKKKAKK